MIDVSKYIEKLELLKKWSDYQIDFHTTRAIYKHHHIEYMGNLSGFWDFETFYKIEIGENILYA